MNLRRAVFFDRDGVLNKSLVVDGMPHAPARLAEFEIEPDARELLLKLDEAGFVLFVVTNQPNVGKGLHDPKEIEAMNRRLADELPLKDIFVCCHRDEDNCECRKPKPGFLLGAAQRHSLALNASFMVGDRWRDVEAGRNAGCSTVWIDRGYAEKKPEGQNFRCMTLREAVEWILAGG